MKIKSIRYCFIYLLFRTLLGLAETIQIDGRAAPKGLFQNLNFLLI